MQLGRLLAPRRTPVEVAKGFASFTQEHGILTYGHVRVGRTPRGLRGLMATKPIAADSVVVAVPDRAFLSIGAAVRNDGFRQLYGGSFPLQPHQLGVRVGSTFLHLPQVAVGCFMAHLLLADQYGKEPLLRYIDFLPRGESHFAELAPLLAPALDHCDVANEAAQRLATLHRLPFGEVRGVIEWAVSMVLSRALPLSHRETLEADLAGTIFADLLSDQPAETKYALPTLCPLLDMANHAADPNACVTVPNDPDALRRVVLLQARRRIEIGEEITMLYGDGDPEALRVFYGIGGAA